MGGAFHRRKGASWEGGLLMERIPSAEEAYSGGKGT